MDIRNMKKIENIFDLLSQLDFLGIHYQIGRFSNISITVQLASPGKRIEIECMDEGQFEISVFEGEEITDLSINFYFRHFIIFRQSLRSQISTSVCFQFFAVGKRLRKNSQIQTTHIRLN